MGQPASKKFLDACSEKKYKECGELLKEHADELFSFEDENVSFPIFGNISL